VLLIVAHPAIATGLETLLKLEGDYDIRRLPNFSSFGALGSWRPEAVLVDGTLLAEESRVTLGVPALVLSGNERDGMSLAARLDDGRGWLRKDATGPELAAGIKGLLRIEPAGGDGLGRSGAIAIVLLVIVVLLAIGYLLYLALY
jgi:hypothetical protein